MTRRERLERKLEKRSEWAGKAEARSEARFGAASAIADRIPFGQPILVGHHSEKRARRDAEKIHTNMDKAVEEHKLAQHHEQKADGLARQLAKNIFDDDPDAIEQLEARIAARIAAGEKAKAINKAWRKGMASVGSQAARAEQLGAAATYVESLGLLDEAECGLAVYRMTLAPWLKSPFSTTGTSQGVRADRERIEAIRKQRERAALAEASPTGVLVQGEAWVRVTFPEKPAREILNALRSAGFQFRGGSWHGERAKLPSEVCS